MSRFGLMMVATGPLLPPDSDARFSDALGCRSSLARESLAGPIGPCGCHSVTGSDSDSDVAAPALAAASLAS